MALMTHSLQNFVIVLINIGIMFFVSRRDHVFTHIRKYEPLKEAVAFLSNSNPG